MKFHNKFQKWKCLSKTQTCERKKHHQQILPKKRWQRSETSFFRKWRLTKSSRFAKLWKAFYSFYKCKVGSCEKHSWAWSKRGRLLGWWWARSLKLAKPVLTKCINTEWEYKILVKNLWWKSLKRDIAMVGSLWPFEFFFLLSLPVSQSLASVVGATVSALVSEFNPLQ